MAMENPFELAIVAIDVAVEFGERERNIVDDRREAAGLDMGAGVAIGRRVDRFPLHDASGLKKANEAREIADLLIGIVDRHGGDAKHRVTAGAAHRVDAAETAAMPDRELG